MSKRVSVRNNLDWTAYTGPTFVESYLKKKKIKAMKQKSGRKTTLRYFIFDLTENTFLYKDSETTPEIKVIHIGKDLKAFSEILDEEEKNICEWPYGFKIMTTIKNYTLYAKSSDIYMRWIDVLKTYFMKLGLFSKLNESPKINRQQTKVAIEELKNDKKLEDNKNKANLNQRGNNPGRFSKIIEETFKEDFMKISQKNNQNKIEPASNLNINSIPTPKNISNKKPLNNQNNNLQRQSFSVDLPAHILHQRGINPNMEELNPLSFKANESKPDFSKPRVIAIEAGNYLKRNSFSNWPGDTNYNAELDEFLHNSPGERNKYNYPVEPANQINADYQLMNNNGDNIRRNLSQNYRPEDNPNTNESRNNLYKKPGKLNDSKSKYSGPIPLENITIDKETPNGFELIVRVPTIPKNNSVSNITNNNENSLYFNMTNDLNFIPSYMNLNNENINLHNSHHSNYNAQESLSKENENNSYTKWDEISNDWTPLISHNKKIQSYIERNKKPNLVLKDQKPSKSNLYDETKMHIKKSDNHNKFSIENLHYYYEEKNQLDNTSINDSSIDKSNKNTSIFMKPRKKENKNKNDKPADITTLSLDGEKVNVKWMLKTTTGNQTAYKIKVPEVLLKDLPSTRHQKMKEMVYEIQHDDPVYLGKNRNTTFEKTFAHQTVNKTNYYDMTVNYVDRSTNENLVGKIMKKPTKEQISNNLTNNNPVAGTPIIEQYGNDEYHLQITNTIKLHSYTHIYDHYHIPKSKLNDIYQLKNYEVFNGNESIEESEGDPLIDDAPDPGYQKFHNHFNLRGREDDPNNILKSNNVIDDNDPEKKKIKIPDTQEQKNPENEKKSDDNNPDDENVENPNNLKEKPNLDDEENADDLVADKPQQNLKSADESPTNNENPEYDGADDNPEIMKPELRTRTQSFNKVEISENNDEEWEDGVDEDGNPIRIQIQKKSIVMVNKNIMIIKGVSGIDNDFDLTNLPDDQKNEDLSDIDQYYHNVSRITENSKMDTNENWNSALSEADV